MFYIHFFFGQSNNTDSAHKCNNSYSEIVILEIIFLQYNLLNITLKWANLAKQNKEFHGCYVSPKYSGP